MPGRDGTGPGGRGQGMGLGRQSRTGAGGGRMGGLTSAGSEGFCECPKCGAKIQHQRAVPCGAMKCPQCGSTMVRA